MWFILIILLIIVGYFFIGEAKPSDEISWGVNFSPKQTKSLGLDAKETYLAILDELGADNVKLAVHWDEIEAEKGEFDFEDIDFYMDEARSRNVKILLAIGMKTPRWPEGHFPEWFGGLSRKKQQQAILDMEKAVVERYKDYPNLYGWQVENEPLFKYGEVPWRDKAFLKKEIEFVKSLDSNHLVITTDSGEMSLWFSIARLSDMVGITMYTKVWFNEFQHYFEYPFPPVYYARKAALVKALFKKDVICVELQAEPWCPDLTQNCSPEEQDKTMNLERFQYNLEYAKETGLDSFYLWGAEWWYWKKVSENNSEIWNEAKSLWN